MKIDLCKLIHRKLDWNDKIPDEIYMVITLRNDQ